MKIESEVLMAEVGRIIGSGQPVILPVSGRSMLPFVVGGKEKIEFRPMAADLQPGDVVMAKVREGYYVVHRIVGIDGDQLTLEGTATWGFRNIAR